MNRHTSTKAGEVGEVRNIIRQRWVVDAVDGHVRALSMITPDGLIHEVLIRLTPANHPVTSVNPQFFNHIAPACSSPRDTFG